MVFHLEWLWKFMRLIIAQFLFLMRSRLCEVKNFLVGPFVSTLNLNELKANARFFNVFYFLQTEQSEI